MSNINITPFYSKGYEQTEIKTISSIEVAEMMGKEHYEILQYLEGRKDKDGKTLVTGIIPTLETEGLQYQKYFIPSTYKAGTREYKCYLVTKMGCELLGNKQQGEKGILFTAKYVERFNQMEQVLHNPYANLSPELQMLIKLEQGQTVLNQRVDEQEQDFVEFKQEFQNFKEEQYIAQVQCQEINNRAKALGVKLLGGKSSPAYQDPSLRGRVYSDIYGQIHREFGVKGCAGIKCKDYSAVFSVINNYSLPKHLLNDIEYANNQMSLAV